MLGRKVNLLAHKVPSDFGHYVEYELDDPSFMADLKTVYGANSKIRIVLPGEPWYNTPYDVSVYVDEGGLVRRIKKSSTFSG